MVQHVQLVLGDEIRVTVDGGKTFRLTVGPLLLGVSIPAVEGGWAEVGFVPLTAPESAPEAAVSVETALKEWPTAVEALTENLTGVPDAMVARMTALPEAAPVVEETPAPAEVPDEPATE
jgi:hypothetical protein